MGWSAIVKVLLPLVEPILMGLYKIIKDISRGNPARKVQKQRDKARDEFNKERDRLREKIGGES